MRNVHIAVFIALDQLKHRFLDGLVTRETLAEVFQSAVRKGGHSVHNKKTAGVVLQLFRYTEACSMLWMVQTAGDPSDWVNY